MNSSFFFPYLTPLVDRRNPMAKLLYSLYLFCFHLLFAAAQTNLFIDGKVADGVPCLDNAGDTPTPCCGPDSTCLTNGLCFDGLTLYRGSCTDQSWTSDQCTKLCMDCKITKTIFSSGFSHRTQLNSVACGLATIMEATRVLTATAQTLSRLQQAGSKSTGGSKTAWA